MILQILLPTGDISPPISSIPTVSLEGVDDLGKDYIKNSQKVRDHLRSSGTFDTPENDLYEPLFPTMYSEDEKGKRHYYSGDDLTLSETFCTALYKFFCPLMPTA